MSPSCVTRGRLLRPGFIPVLGVSARREEAQAQAQCSTRLGTGTKRPFPFQRPVVAPHQQTDHGCYYQKWEEARLGKKKIHWRPLTSHG